MDDLPESVVEIAEAIGLDDTFKLIRAAPPLSSRSWRVVIYVPRRKRLRRSHWIVSALGWEAALRLCDHFGGEQLQPSNCRFIDRRWRRELVRRMREEHGWDPGRICQEINGYGAAGLATIETIRKDIAALERAKRAGLSGRAKG